MESDLHAVAPQSFGTNRPFTRPRAAGKPAKMALAACMRTLHVIVDAVLAG